jgi:hypothetical protein
LRSALKWNESGKDWALAASLTVMKRSWAGWIMIPFDFNGLRVVTIVWNGCIGCSLPSAPAQCPFLDAVCARHHGIVFSAPLRRCSHFAPARLWHLHIVFAFPVPAYSLKITCQWVSKFVTIIEKVLTSPLKGLYQRN